MPWRTWNFREWNRRLFNHYFLRTEGSSEIVKNFIVTIGTIGRIAEAEVADHEAAKDQLFTVVRESLTRVSSRGEKNSVSLPEAAKRCYENWNVRAFPPEPPPFFIYLFTICCAAALFDENQTDDCSIHENLRSILEQSSILYDSNSYAQPNTRIQTRWQDIQTWCVTNADSYRQLELPTRDLLDNRAMTAIGHGPTMAIPRGRDMEHLAAMIARVTDIGEIPSLSTALRLARRARFDGGYSEKVKSLATTFQDNPDQESGFWHLLNEAAIYGPVFDPAFRGLWLIGSQDFLGDLQVILAGPLGAPSMGFVPLSDPLALHPNIADLRIDSCSREWLWGESDGAKALLGNQAALTELQEVHRRLFRLVSQGVMPFRRTLEWLVVTDSRDYSDLALVLVRTDLADKFCGHYGGRGIESGYAGWKLVEGAVIEEPPPDGPLSLISCLQVPPPRNKRGWCRGGVRIDRREETPQYLGNGFGMPEFVNRVPVRAEWIGKVLELNPGVHVLPILGDPGPKWESRLVVREAGGGDTILDRLFQFRNDPSSVALAEIDQTRFTAAGVFGQRPLREGGGFPGRPMGSEPDDLAEVYRPTMLLGRNPGQWVDDPGSATWQLTWDGGIRNWVAKFLPIGKGCGHNPCQCLDEVVEWAWTKGKPLEFGAQSQKTRWRRLLEHSIKEPCTKKIFEIHRVNDLMRGRNPRPVVPFRQAPHESLAGGGVFNRETVGGVWVARDDRADRLRKLTSTLIAVGQSEPFISLGRWRESAIFAGVPEDRLWDLIYSWEEACLLDVVRMMQRPYLWGIRLLPPSLARFQEGEKHYWISFGVWLPGQTGRFAESLNIPGLETGALIRQSTDLWVPSGFRLETDAGDDRYRQNILRAAQSSGITLVDLEKDKLLDWFTALAGFDNLGAPRPRGASRVRPVGRPGFRAIEWSTEDRLTYFTTEDEACWAFDRRRAILLGAMESGKQPYSRLGETGILVEPGINLPVQIVRTAALLGPRLPDQDDHGATRLFFPNTKLRDLSMDQIANSHLSPILS